MIDEVTQILQEAAVTAVLPRYQALAEGEVSEKSPGEVVTAADREAEELITRRLRALLDIPVVGEEASAADPGLAAALREAPAAWLVDPLDGTANFVAGRPHYAVMAALVRAGEAVASWIVQPATGHVYRAEQGAGAWRDGVRLRRAPAPGTLGELRGAALSRFLDPAARERVARAAGRLAELGSGTGSAGVDYPDLLTGRLDFLRYHRTLPWDHAPGVLLVREAGGVARRLDGAEYRAAEERTGLLVAADPQCWTTVRSVLEE
ncbi:inositol monophosphatase family protein [Kitasatospora sp. NBC_01266]|uniref:inositol monophosphatase family protein n=1 Tax=Kitasatospora sp. NBC_01266 TaxID=2903572 RepID=UPI002E33E839|nr:inositol monophosphatase [Kitasatospora sp. NBC_01266]